MLSESVTAILDRVGADETVLDLGGWWAPFTRADWVMDLMPYSTRGPGGHHGAEDERFTAETWIQRDLCDREPYPFADKQIDFVVCSHTLEDVRDPLWVCGEMIRVGKAGYIEVPSRLEEQAYGFQGPWAGWAHHRWLIDIADGGIDFVFKHHVVNGRDTDHFPPGFQQALSAEQRVQTLWWEGSFPGRERVFIDAEELDAYVAGFVARHRNDVSPLPTPASRTRRLVGRVRGAIASRGRTSAQPRADHDSSRP